MTTLVTHDRLARNGLPSISWGAVFAGIILSLIILLTLGVLGAAIGASALAPLQYQNPLHGFGFGTGVWVVFMMVVALIAGAYFAGRCAPVLGWLHGILMWAVVVLVTSYLASALIGTTVNVVSNVAANASAAASNSEVGKAANSLLDSAGQTLRQHGINVPSAQPQSDTQMRENADAASRQVARATWWSFALLVLGAVISCAAGHLGFRHHPRVEVADDEVNVPVTTTTYTERTTTTGHRRPV
jgi:MFS family permease